MTMPIKRDTRLWNNARAITQNWVDQIYPLLFHFPIVFENEERKTLGAVTYENGNYTFLSARELREHARYVSNISAGIFGTENKINLYKSVLNKLSRRQRLLKKYPSLGKEVIPVFNPNNRRGLSTTARRLPLLQA